MSKVRSLCAAILFGFAIGLPMGIIYIDAAGGIKSPEEAVALSLKIIQDLGIWAFAIDFLILSSIGYFLFSRRKAQSDPEADD